MRLAKIQSVFLMVSLSMSLASHPATAEGIVGVRRIAVHSAERDAALDVTVWYPAQSGGERVVLGESPFFTGTPALRDAPVAPGKYSLILLSHGAGLAGNPQAISWIAAPLAKHGFIVAAPTHPGNSGPNRSAAETMKLWLRPADLTATLNSVTGSAAIRDHLKGGKVGVLGLSMGGTTALAMAGARLSPNLLAGYCDTDASNASLCGWVRQSGVDLHKLNMTLAGRDNREPRVSFAMSIDPAPVDVLEPKSLSGITIPVEIVNLGKPGQIPITAKADEIAKAMPGGRYTIIEDASHYSMFGECKPGAAALAEKEDVGEPICTDGGGRPRGQIHAQLIDMTISAFERALGGSP